MAIHHIFKKIWRHIEQTKMSVNRSEKIVQEGWEVEVLESVPPQYTEFPLEDDSKNSPSNSNTTYPLLTKIAQHSKQTQRDRLLWFLVEVIAVTFSTDCRRLKEVFLKTDPGWAVTVRIEDSSSITHAEGRAWITELSALIRNLQKEMSYGRWLLVRGRDKDLVQKIVLEPVKDLNLNLDYVLEVIGRYRRLEGCLTPKSTLVDHWTHSSSGTDLGDTIASHALLLQSLRLEAELHSILEDSIVTYQKENGLVRLHTSKELQEESMMSLAKTCCWPLSDVYMDLARGLRGLQTCGKMHDPFGPSRARLREGRKFRKHRE